MYAEAYHEACPLHLQEPVRKTLNISFIGFPPFITYNPVGGSDVIVTNLLANKFHFLPKYLPARSKDKLESNFSSYGMVHWVSIGKFCKKFKYNHVFIVSGFFKTK